ncbi:MAG: 30S ribosomal protein S4 [Chloroflexi bacterium]|mgnify:CR=1 FL=1|nr:30S ribosomal protein S4 [Anaerolineae bacterium]RLC73248.1 MAG: 30S ribosomal protein S4 [Chloroflexota bacterium]
MARYLGPVCKLCRREGEKLFLKGERCLSAKCALERRAYPPGMHGRESQFRRGRASEYSLQLREKQKVRRIYGVLERQFRRYYKEALRRKGLTGENLLIILESRLDNVVYRLGFASSRAQARQLVQHGHFYLNGRRATIPSMLLKPGDEISVRPQSRQLKYFKDLAKVLDEKDVPNWLSLDTTNLLGRVLNLPTREEIAPSINEHLIVEYYSR